MVRDAGWTESTIFTLTETTAGFTRRSAARKTASPVRLLGAVAWLTAVAPAAESSPIGAGRDKRGDGRRIERGFAWKMKRELSAVCHDVTSGSAIACAISGSCS